jgi:hypothetical protein
MSKNGLRRHYDRLTPEERFRLDVLAQARGDLEESERLTRTCQRETYTMNHRGYTGWWNGTYDITLHMYVALGERLAKLQMVDAFRELVPYSQAFSGNMIFDGYFRGHESGSRHAWDRAGKDGEPPGYEEDPEEADETADPTIDADADGFEAMIEQYGGSYRRCSTSWSAPSPRTPGACGRASQASATCAWASRRRRLSRWPWSRPWSA